MCHYSVLCTYVYVMCDFVILKLQTPTNLK